jgi:outer membrane cobalamin receptor
MKKAILSMVAVMLLSVAAIAQTTVKGIVVDGSTNESLPGASVVVPGTTAGTVSGFDGSFQFNLPDGANKIVVSFVGFLDKEIKVIGAQDLGTIKLESDAVGLNEVSVMASVAIDRQTPVAVSTISPTIIAEKLGTQEFPEVLKSTPGVYATKQGGGFGDSRINMRGFDSRNIAVMINGVPVNDMENGWVYWSNWAGLSDVTRSMQTQRGLGASKVAVPSVGGTINILTKTTDAKRGGNVAAYVGNDGYQKQAITLSSGLSKNNWATTFSLARTTGNGWVDGTEFESYSYFLNISKRINDKHSLSFSIFGAPQTHGQRKYTMSVRTYEDSRRGLRYNDGWGYKNGKVTYLTENFYHKPQGILNHFWTLSDKTTVSTAAYFSLGGGGGTGGYGKSKFGQEDYIRDEQINFDKIVDENIAAGNNGSETILRASHNDHVWTGVLSTLRHDMGDLVLSGSVDGRYYKGRHYRKVTDLLGGKFFVEEDVDVNNPNKIVRKGDKIGYYNDGEVKWIGLSGQAEYSKDALSTFISVAASNQSYRRTDYFNYLDSDKNQQTKWVDFWGYSVKGGANYNLDEKQNIFVNAGYFERQPDFRNVFLNYKNIINADAKNEKTMSFEVGYGFRNSWLSVNINAYYTQWNDKAFVKSVKVEDQDLGDKYYNANILGVDANHKGIELDFVAKPFDGLSIRGMASVGDWKWDNDVRNVTLYDDNQNLLKTYDLYLKGLHVGDAAQTTAALSVNYELLEGLKVGMDYNYYADLYAEYDPLDRDDSDKAGVDAWKLPDYGLFDANLKYTFKFGSLNSTFYANVNNIFNTEYFAEADDGSNQDWQTSKVFYGIGRTWSCGLKINF